MRHFVYAALFALALFSLSLAKADQHSEQLPDLLTALGNAVDAVEGHAVEQQIWALWLAGPDPAADRLLQQARAAADAGQMDNSLEFFNRLTSQFPDYAEGWNQRAIFHYLLGNIQGSLDDIARALELEPRHFGALAGRGQCFLRLDRPQDALEAFEQSLQFNPWSETVEQQIEVLRTYLHDKLTPI